jgi:CubicO group peptidase (beta-lactamase class C family)
VRYLPDLRLGDPGAAARLSLRQLLSHSSGFPADEEWARLVPATRAGIVREFASMPMTAAAGARFQYCSRCIVLAAAVLEKITGQSWEAYTRQEIFRPVGMTTASFGPRGLEEAADRAQPYRQGAVSGEVPVAWSRLDYLQPLGPAGGINADIDDMARYALMQLDEGLSSGERVLSAEMMAELHRPEIGTGADWRTAAQFQNVQYALGWFTGDFHGRRLVFHNGVNPGFRAAIVLIPAEKAGAVILTNAESAPFIAAAREAILKELLP